MPDWNLSGIERPWGRRPSIYRHIASRIATRVSSAEEPVPRGGEHLPDEEVVNLGRSLSWIAGAEDSVTGGAADDRSAQKYAAQVVEALWDLTEEATQENALVLYGLLTGRRAMEYVEPLLQKAAEYGEMDGERLRAVIRWLASEAPDREPVKVALALLALFPRTGDRDMILTLGRHEEFTLFATSALSHIEEDPDRDLWELGRCLTGWGRIHIIERLARTEKEDIHAWMLRKGYANDVMNEYTACICAETGDLAGALEAGIPDEALMKGAGELLLALIKGREIERGDDTVEGMGNYTEGVEATGLYLRHLQQRPVGLREVYVLHAIGSFLQGEFVDGVPDEESSVHDPALGWPERREELLEAVEEVLSRPGLTEMVCEGLRAPDRESFTAATLAAPTFGIDTWPAYFERLESGEGNYWYLVMQTEDPERADRVLELARKRLPLTRMTGEPVDELGLGAEWEDHRTLDSILQDLRRFPGKGREFVLTGLQSPLTRNRNMAVRVLAAWSRGTWPEEAEQILLEAAEREASESVREKIERTLEGEPLD